MNNTKTAKPNFTFSPFKELKEMIGDQHSEDPVGTEVQSLAPDIHAEDRPEDNRVFLDAVAGIKPLTGDRSVRRVPEVRLTNYPVVDEDGDVLDQLRNLVACGRGYIVADTPEYIEGTGYGVPREFARRLHRGDYAIQAHIDLHGLNVEKAGQAFDAFMKESVLKSRGAVLIIHGRGLSSPEEPVLKKRIMEWLSGNQWRKWVVAFASARPVDGGTGATYVLLRSRPASKPKKRKTPL